MSKRLLPFACLSMLLTLCPTMDAQAQGGRLRQMNNSFSNDFDMGDFAATVMAGDEEAQAAERERGRQAEINFDSIVVPQNKLEPNKAPPRRMRQMPGNLNRFRSAGEDIAADAPEPAAAHAYRSPEEPEVEMSLPEYEALRDKLKTVRREAARRLGPAVVLGASSYSGEAIHGALSLKLNLQVTLGRPGAWKTVPIIGDDVVLVRARVKGRDLPVSRRQGYHVWVTQETGEVTIQAEILVPSRGPRGSIEYDFLVARTPVTRFECTFPLQGLEPRMNAAVQSDTRETEGGTKFTATLRPTTHIHLLGFKNMGDDSGQQAKVYAESLHLLSVEEGAMELFSVVRYTILYAGAKEFVIALPKDMKVVSAKGMGAFRWELGQDETGKPLLRGETAFPIRNKFEISLRLRREMAKESDGAFDAPLPHCLGVERESGWLGLEVPGKLQLETKPPVNADAIDVRQLPAEMIQSAVSPILRAYRYHEPKPKVGLAVRHLPEIEPASDSIDRVKVFSKITVEGKVLTDMRITLRNRLLQNLRMRLPKGASIKSALLDGQPFNPSRNADGQVLLPLKRSTGRERLRPFTLSVVIEQNMDDLGLFGHPVLRIPQLDLPISSLGWTVYAPGRNIYTRLEGDLDEQQYMGKAGWHKPAPSWGDPGIGADLAVRALSISDGASSADGGAMPVRFKVPKEGKRLDHSRYWIAAEAPVSVSFLYARGWLRIPAWMAMATLLALGLWMVSLRFRSLPSRMVPLFGLALVIAGWCLARWLGGSMAVFLGMMGGFFIIAVHRQWLRLGPEAISAWTGSLAERFSQREKDPKGWGASRILLSVGLGFFGLILVSLFLELIWLLFSPLGG
ncbi:MAG: hypothetical protein JRF33_02640 [Deltaproteobacteria bacterium]|nr:hypothetical protein [Deltaproteobacteria bacterium]